MQDGKNVADIAAENKGLSLSLTFLIEQGIFGLTQSANKDTLFLKAADHCRVTLMKTLKSTWTCNVMVTNGKSLNAMDLVVANANKKSEAVQTAAIKFLMASGVFGTTNAASKQGLFIRAIENGDTETMAKLISSNHVDLSKFSSYSKHPMDVAVEAKQWSAVKLLMESKVVRKKEAEKPANMMEWPLETLTEDTASTYLYELVSALDVTANHTDVLSLTRPGETILRKIWNSVLANFKGVVDGPPDVNWSVVFKASKLYLVNDIELARQQSENLSAVCKSLLTGSKGAMYAGCLGNIMYDPLFNDYSSMLTDLQTHVQSNFKNQKPTQISNSGVVNLEVVYRNSKSVKQRFDSFFKKICADTDNDAMTTETLKFPYRSMQKMANSLDAQWNAANCKDIVRGAANMGNMVSGIQLLNVLVSADDSEHMTKFMREAINAETQAPTFTNYGSREDRIRIVWIKNRWATPTSAGWADALINFYFVEDPTRTICELQLIHKSMWRIRSNLGAHDGYDKLRVVQELLRATGNKKALDEIEAAAIKSKPMRRPRSSSAVGGTDGGAAVAECRASIAALTAAVDAMTANNSNLNVALAEMRAENAEMRAENASLKENQEKMASSVLELVDEKSALRKRLFDLESAVESAFDGIAPGIQNTALSRSPARDVISNDDQISTSGRKASTLWKLATNAIRISENSIGAGELPTIPDHVPSAPEEIRDDHNGGTTTADGTAAAEITTEPITVMARDGASDAIATLTTSAPDGATTTPNARGANEEVDASGAAESTSSSTLAAAAGATGANSTSVHENDANNDAFRLLDLSSEMLDQFGFAKTGLPAPLQDNEVAMDSAVTRHAATTDMEAGFGFGFEEMVDDNGNTGIHL